MGQLTEITIRPLRPEDLDDAVALEVAHQPTPWSTGVFRDELAAGDRIYLGAFGEELLGYAGVMLVGEEAHVTNLLVAPERRRQGIGLRLMVDLTRMAIESGARHITLEVRSRNTSAQSLYARLGLAPVGVRKRYYQDDDALILWAHDIDRTDFQTHLGSLA
jgi:[ribosomal protein S18]-alanine N-acetyltransferase